jgi:hypothetical protein
MTVGFSAIVQAAESHALTLGVFDRVNRHEPANAPNQGLSLAIWFDRLRTFRGTSGLASTSAIISLNERITSTLQQDPADDIDVRMMDALDVLFEAYAGDFSLGGLVESVDLLGRSEIGPLRADGGYLETGDQTFRAYSIVVPIVVNDAWTQTA